MNLLELGGLLKKEREQRRLSLRDVMEATKISRRNLNALEAGQLEQLPHPVYLKGYVRNYARLLRLDPEPLVAVVDMQSDGDSGYLPHTAVSAASPAPQPEAVPPVVETPVVETSTNSDASEPEAAPMTREGQERQEEQPAAQPEPAAPATVSRPDHDPMESLASQLSIAEATGARPRRRPSLWPWVLLLLFAMVMGGLYFQYQRIQAEVEKTPLAAPEVNATDNATANATDNATDNATANATENATANATLGAANATAAAAASAFANATSSVGLSSGHAVGQGGASWGQALNNSANATKTQPAPDVSVSAKPAPTVPAAQGASAKPAAAASQGASAKPSPTGSLGAGVSVPSTPIEVSKKAAQPTAEAKTPGAQALVITAKPGETCWVEVTEGGMKKSGILRDGESRRFEFSSKARVRLGNAGGVSFQLNGAPYPFEGERGATATVEIQGRP